MTEDHRSFMVPLPFWLKPSTKHALVLSPVFSWCFCYYGGGFGQAGKLHASIRKTRAPARLHR